MKRISQYVIKKNTYKYRGSMLAILIATHKDITKHLNKVILEQYCVIMKCEHDRKMLFYNNFMREKNNKVYSVLCEKESATKDKIKLYEWYLTIIKNKEEI